MLLCGFHHTLIHEHGFGVTTDDRGEIVFRDADGWPLPERPPVIRLDRLERIGPEARGEAPLYRLIRENRARGVRPDHATARAGCRRERDMPDGVYEAALLALDRADGTGLGEGAEAQPDE